MQICFLIAVAGLLGLLLRWPAWLGLGMLGGGLLLLAALTASRLFDLMRPGGRRR